MFCFFFLLISYSLEDDTNSKYGDAEDIDDDGATKDSAEARSSSATDSKEGNNELDRPGSSGNFAFCLYFFNL